MDSELIRSLASALNVQPFIASLLVRRGITTFEDARDYFNPSLANLYDPFLFSQMDRATSRLKSAIDGQERVLVYGDYDTDGVCAVTILVHFLKNQGLEVLSYIPDRITEGYGTTDKGVKHIIDEKVDLVIMVDCGIRSFYHVNQLNEKGIDSIICDHHIPDSKPPEAYAILNPHSEAEKYPEQNLCGSGVVFKLIQAMCRRYFSAYDANSHLDFVALATVADIVPLLGENRILVHHGLKKLRENPHPTLAALLEALNISKEAVSYRDLGFSVSPCVNAAGRIKHAKKALALFLAEDPIKYAPQAKLLKELNEQRKTLQTQQSAQAIEQLEVQEKFAFSVSFDWHPGLVGLIANRAVEHSEKPAIILHKSRNSELCTGSARSIEGLDITASLSQCADLLERFGGHSKAAGLTIHKNNIDKFKIRLNSIWAKTSYKASEIAYDEELAPQLLTIKRIRIIERMQPFGVGNPEPVFRISRVYLQSKPTILKDIHIKFCLPNTDLEFIGFNKLSEFQALKDVEPFDIYFSVSINTFQNYERPQFIIHKLRASL